MIKVLLVRSADPACPTTALVREAVNQNSETKLIYLQEFRPDSSAVDYIWQWAEGKMIHQGEIVDSPKISDRKNHALVGITTVGAGGKYDKYLLNPTQQEVGACLEKCVSESLARVVNLAAESTRLLN